MNRRTRQRNEARKRAASQQIGQLAALAYAAGIALAENPNRAKHHTARLGLAGWDDETFRPDSAELKIRACERDYRPLTVRTPTRDKIGRRNPRSLTHYTI